ncbi:MAG: peptide ABC transporter substrate-binding protein [Eubacterium sp.]|nr:peptide ABC transporter substrate-binding protein [Eubacterium sp.]
MKKLLSIMLCTIIVASAFSGCAPKNEKIDLIYPFGGKVNSYDPQIASTSDEFVIIENCFEGLVRCDDEGNIIPGCAASWDISDDGLVYTFNLSKGLHWYIYNSVKNRMGKDYDPEITAHDFVFALQRAVDPATSAPLYSTISNIVNANKINAGKMKKSKLGVKALDDYTLEIRLTSPDNAFLQTLSTSIAMPCNKEFFDKTNGRYGLDLQYTMFNGQFVVTNELDSSYILKKSIATKDGVQTNGYRGPSPAKASVLTLKIVDKYESIADRLKSGYYDAAYIRGYESAAISNKSDLTLVPYSNTTWSLVMNSGKGILSSVDARHAIALSLSDADLEAYPYLTKATGFIPPSCIAGNGAYTENGYDITEKQNPGKAVSLWKKAVSDTSAYNIELVFLAPDYMEALAKQLLQGLQSSIGSISNAEEDKKISFTLKLVTKTESELKAAVSSGNYDIAIYPLTASASSPVSFLQSFLTEGVSFFDTKDFSAALKKAGSAKASKLAQECYKCEKELLSSYCYVPMFFESSYYAAAKGVSGVQFHPGTGRVCFVYTNRE